MNDTRVPAAAAKEGAVIRCQGLQKSFKDFFGRSKVQAVRGVSFDVRPGEIFGFLGPNGCGKTTTIKMLLGLLRPDAGSAFLFGEPAGSLAARRRVGYMPEQPYFYGHLRPMEFLELCATLQDVPAAERRDRCVAMLKKVGLVDVERRALRKFSKGMLQRIGIAQALIGDPDLVILDEPLSGLDPIGRKELRDLVAELRDEGKTVFLCSHILHDVELLADRVALVIQGSVRDCGTLESLLQPKVLSVAVAFGPVEGERGQRVLAAAREAGAAVDIRGDRASGVLPQEVAVEDLLRALLAAGAQIYAVTERRESLEDYLFEQATGHSAGEGKA